MSLICNMEISESEIRHTVGVFVMYDISKEQGNVLVSL